MMTRMIYRVRFGSRQQLRRVPIAWLELSVDGIDESDTACSLIYHDPRLAFQVALVSDGTVVPERQPFFWPMEENDVRFSIN